MIGHLVNANLAGHDSHGVGMIPAYVRHLKACLVSPNTPAKVVKDDGAILMFDCQRGYGRRVSGEAMEAGTSGVFLLYENVWAAPFAVAVRKAGGQLVASGRIPVQSIIAALDDLEAADQS